MHLRPWPGDYKLILHSCRVDTRKDFQDGCSERIRVKRNHAFGPPQCYQITADTSPTTPRALAQITSWEGEGREMLVSLCLCVGLCACVCLCMFVWEAEKRTETSSAVSREDRFQPISRLLHSQRWHMKDKCLWSVEHHVWQLCSISDRKTWVKMRFQQDEDEANMEQR